MTKTSAVDKGTRTLVARAFTAVEDGVYIGLGVLLAVGAVVLLGKRGGLFLPRSGGGASSGRGGRSPRSLLLVVGRGERECDVLARLHLDLPGDPRDAVARCLRRKRAGCRLVDLRDRHPIRSLQINSGRRDPTCIVDAQLVLLRRAGLRLGRRHHDMRR